METNLGKNFPEIKQGITKPNKYPKSNQRIGYETDFVIKRSDYGVNTDPVAVGDDAQIPFEIEAIHK